MKIITVILLSILSFQGLSQEPDDIQYVTGKLYLSLYQQADSGSQVIKSLISGDRLDVIEIAGPYAKVITDQGKEGWVKKGFMVKEKPSSILLKEKIKAYNKLQAEMTAYKESNQSVSDLSNQLETLKVENEELKIIKEIYLRQKEKMDLLAEEADLKMLNAEKSIDLDVFISFIKEYFFYLLATFILLILVGFRVGELKTESEVINHFGGIKVW